MNRFPETLILELTIAVRAEGKRNLETERFPLMPDRYLLTPDLLIPDQRTSKCEP